ncbi:mitochondrial coiled-coil domain protein 1 [Orycteropus afer afer]|uniref:Mitochondrial coiled-coil domain protein 1 n=1 Tax=Orycteropus afer afer TaxID=1230840 RepID=A0A8B7ANS1_ORYAF|nr:mitochondrial coiled-coil domain protein 1 [Orycteropus afer afer]
MVLPLSQLSRCYCRGLLLSWSLAPQASRGCCSQTPRTSTEEQTSSSDSGKMSSPARGAGPQRTAELAQAEELLEQQLELYQALLEGQEGAWEAQALVLKIQKLKEQMRHRESQGGDGCLSFPAVPNSPTNAGNKAHHSAQVLQSGTSQPLPEH